MTIVFLSFFILFYLKSSKNKEKILLASLFFFLALWAGTARAYLIFPIPLVVEFAHLIKKFNIRLFILRIVIFYLLPLGFFVNMPGMSVRFQPYQAILIRLNQITTGNLYTLTLPFQMISSLFIDQRILADILGYVPLPIKDNLLRGFLVINLILLGLSILVGFVINKKRVKFFAAKLMIPTLILQIVFYLFGKLSAELVGVPFKDPQGFVYWLAPLNPTIFQTSLGVYFVILGILLFWEWWNYQRKNKVLMVVVFAWIWSVASELLSFLTTNWWNMILESNDRYVLVCSLGAVVFVAGMLTLCARRLWELQGLVVRKFLPFFLLGSGVLLLIYKDYKVIDQHFYGFNERDGGSIYWQNLFYQKFLAKFGKDNLKKPAFLYIDNGKYVQPKTSAMTFNQGAFIATIFYRIYYDEKNNLVRDNCKAVTDDIELVKSTYTMQDNKKGFVVNTECVAEKFSTRGDIVFYPLDNFYAYRIENKEFIDIKDEVLLELEKNKKDN